jgi:hypothetical protein
VSRERLATLALRAFPAGAWDAQRDEMLATALDASAGSPRRFVGELRDIVRTGVRARATETARVGAARLLADGICLGGAWLMTLALSTLLAQRARGMEDALLAWPSIALVGAALAMALVGHDRIAGGGALTWTALRLPELLDRHPGVAGLAPEVLPVLCFAVMVLVPRRRSHDLRRVAWLVVPAALVLTLGPPQQEQNPLLLAGVVLAVACVAVASIAMLATDPRLAIACALPLTSVGIDVVVAGPAPELLPLLFLAAAPLALAAGAASTRGLRRRAPI